MDRLVLVSYQILMIAVFLQFRPAVGSKPGFYLLSVLTRILLCRTKSDLDLTATVVSRCHILRIQSISSCKGQILARRNLKQWSSNEVLAVSGPQCSLISNVMTSDNNSMNLKSGKRAEIMIILDGISWVPEGACTEAANILLERLEHKYMVCHHKGNR